MHDGRNPCILPVLLFCDMEPDPDIQAWAEEEIAEEVNLVMPGVLDPVPEADGPVPDPTVLQARQVIIPARRGGKRPHHARGTAGLTSSPVLASSNCRAGQTPLVLALQPLNTPNTATQRRRGHVSRSPCCRTAARRAGEAQQITANPPGSIRVDINDGDGLAPVFTNLIANTGSSYAGMSSVRPASRSAWGLRAALAASRKSSSVDLALAQSSSVHSASSGFPAI